MINNALFGSGYAGLGISTSPFQLEAIVGAPL
jgi:hypothetical protein